MAEDSLHTLRVIVIEFRACDSAHIVCSALDRVFLELDIFDALCPREGHAVGSHPTVSHIDSSGILETSTVHSFVQSVC